MLVFNLHIKPEGVIGYWISSLLTGWGNVCAPTHTVAGKNLRRLVVIWVVSCTVSSRPQIIVKTDPGKHVQSVHERVFW